MKLTVKNFQSIEYQEICFSNFSILIGSSNLGKSSLLRALKCVLYNDFEKSYIRNSSDTCFISLEFSSSNYLNLKSISFTRSYVKSINEYKIEYMDGSIEIFDKVGIDTPMVVKSLGYKYLELERTSEKINLNFQSQLEGLFLISSSEVHISSFLNKVFNVDKYEIALRDCNKDILSFSKDFSAFQKELSQCETDLTQANIDLSNSKILYDKHKAIANRVDLLVKYKEYIETTKNVTLSLSEDQLRLDFLKNKVLTIESFKYQLELLKSLKVVKDSTSSLNALKTLKPKLQSFKHLSKCSVDILLKILNLKLLKVPLLSISKCQELLNTIKSSLVKIAKIPLKTLFLLKKLSQLSSIKYIESNNSYCLSKLQLSLESSLEFLAKIDYLLVFKMHLISFDHIKSKQIKRPSLVSLFNSSLVSSNRLCKECNSLICK